MASLGAEGRVNHASDHRRKRTLEMPHWRRTDCSRPRSPKTTEHRRAAAAAVTARSPPWLIDDEEEVKGATLKCQLTFPRRPLFFSLAKLRRLFSNL